VLIYRPAGFVPETIDLHDPNVMGGLDDGSLFSTIVTAMNRGALVNCTRSAGEKHRAKGTDGCNCLLREDCQS
jgi:hypothetical protein